MKLPNNIDGWVKFLANCNATVVDSPAGPTLRMARNSTIPFHLASGARQTVAKMLVDHFGTIKAVREEIEKNKERQGMRAGS